MCRLLLYGDRLQKRINEITDVRSVGPRPLPETIDLLTGVGLCILVSV